MTTDSKTLTTSEAAARVGLSHQYLRFLLSKGKGPKGTREGKAGRGGGYKFLAADIDTWDAARTKQAPKVKTDAVMSLPTGTGLGVPVEVLSGTPPKETSNDDA